MTKTDCSNVGARIEKSMLDNVVKELNRMLELDRVSMSSMFKNTMTCKLCLSESMLEVMPLSGNIYAFNVLSIINAVLSVNNTSDYRIACTCFDNGLVHEFYVHKAIDIDENPEEPPEDG